MPTVTLYPSAYSAPSSVVASITRADNPVGKGVTNTTYAQIGLVTGANVATSAYYLFDTSSIPVGAVINSVTARAKAYINTTTSSRVSQRTIQLYAGLDAKGSAANVSTSTSALTLTAGTWTREELNGACIRLFARRGSSSTSSSYYFRFYGAELVVNYTVPQRTLTIQNGDGIQITPSQSGQYDHGTVVPVTINAQTLPEVTLDGTDITGLFTSSGTVHTASVTMDADHTLVVSIPSTGLFVKRGGSWVTVRKIYRKINGSWTEQAGNPFGDAADDTNSGYNTDIEQI